MFENIDKLMLAGLGALSMTREKAEKLFDEYVRRGQAEKANRAGFVKDLMDSAERTRKDIEQLVADQVRAALAKMNLPTREDLSRLEAKIDDFVAARER